MMTSEPLKVPPEAICRGCGYALRELTVPRCPECGRLFDPNDPRTWTTGGKFGSLPWWQKRLATCARAPTRWEILAASAVTVFVLMRVMRLPWRDNDEAVPILFVVAGYLTAIIAVRFWLAALCRMISITTPKEPYRKLRFLCLPLCVVVFLLAVGWRETVLQRRCVRYQKPLTELCSDSLKRPGTVLRRVGDLGIVTATSQPAGTVELWIDLDYHDRWSTCPCRVLFDPARSSVQPPARPVWLAKGFYVRERARLKPSQLSGRRTECPGRKQPASLFSKSCQIENRRSRDMRKKKPAHAERLLRKLSDK